MVAVLKRPSRLQSARRHTDAPHNREAGIGGRLQTAAGPGQILIDEATHNAVRDRVVSQDLGSLRLAGKGDWISVFNVHDWKDE